MGGVDELDVAVATCERLGWASVADAVALGEIGALEASVADLVLEPLASEVGPVRQAGAAAICAVAGRPALEALAARLGRAASATGMSWNPDEAATTAYGPGEGISPHRDNAYYTGLVAVVTLTGSAEIRVVADRAGRQELACWTAGPGHLALFRGPRPGGEGRPIHGVGAAGPAGRRVLVLRRNTRGAGRGWMDG